jgi:hypothetical protein
MMMTGLAKLALAIMLTVVAEPTLAHPARSFDACAAYRRHGGICADTATYVIGDRVFLRARVEPAHEGRDAFVTFLRPGAERWRRGVSVHITASGRTRWSFRATKVEADRSEPWRFRFRIPGHGASDAMTVFILFGE